MLKISEDAGTPTEVYTSAWLYLPKPKVMWLNSNNICMKKTNKQIDSKQQTNVIKLNVMLTLVHASVDDQMSETQIAGTDMNFIYDKQRGNR